MKRPIKIRHTITCAWCEKEFTAKKKHAKTCSANCRVAKNNAERHHKSQP